MSDNEPYRTFDHNEACQMVGLRLAQTGEPALREYKLPNGKIADFIFLSRAGDIVIIEVKTLLRTSLMAEAWDKYRVYCNRLYMAVPMVTPHDLLMFQGELGWSMRISQVGVISLDPECSAVLRDATHRGMLPEHQDRIGPDLVIPCQNMASRVFHI